LCKKAADFHIGISDEESTDIQPADTIVHPLDIERDAIVEQYSSAYCIYFQIYLNRKLLEIAESNAKGSNMFSSIASNQSKRQVAKIFLNVLGTCISSSQSY
jgi:hypothetical protein